MSNKIDTEESRRFDSAPSQTPLAAAFAALRTPSAENVERNVEDLSGGGRTPVAARRQKSAGADERANISAMRIAPPPSQFASEAGHWYLPDGSPFYTVPNKSKPGKTRPVTLTDAKKVGAVPSVTGITGLIKGEGLINYIRKQVFEATLQCPYALTSIVDGKKVTETPEAHMARALAMAEQHKEKAAERGTSLHADIERRLMGQPVSDKWSAHVGNLVETLEQLSIYLCDGEPEKSFAHPLGFGGKCDFHQRSEPVVIDFKSKDSVEPGKKYAYDEHAMQVAAYSVGLGLSLRTVRGINVFIGEQDQRILVHEWAEADLQSAWTQFKHLLAVWQIRKKYCPAFGTEEREQ